MTVFFMNTKLDCFLKLTYEQKLYWALEEKLSLFLSPPPLSVYVYVYIHNSLLTYLVSIL